MKRFLEWVWHLVLLHLEGPYSMAWNLYPDPSHPRTFENVGSVGEINLLNLLSERGHNFFMKRCLGWVWHLRHLILGGGGHIQWFEICTLLPPPPQQNLYMLIEMDLRVANFTLWRLIHLYWVICNTGISYGLHNTLGGSIYNDNIHTSTHKIYAC